MEKMLLFSMSLLISALASAQVIGVGDKESVIYSCEREIHMADNGLQMELTAGGFVGTKITTKRSLFAGLTEDTFIARQETTKMPRPGAPQVYKGRGVSFTINMTVAPRPDQKHLGILKTQKYGTENVLCVLGR